MLSDIIDFLQDPGNAWILYLIAAVLLLDWLTLQWFRKRIVAAASKRGVAIGGDNSGVVVTGRVDGDVVQRRESRGRDADTSAAASPARIDRVLSLAANVSGILGLLIAAAAFFSQQS